MHRFNPFGYSWRRYASPTSKTAGRFQRTHLCTCPTIALWIIHGLCTCSIRRVPCCLPGWASIAGTLELIVHSHGAQQHVDMVSNVIHCEREAANHHTVLFRRTVWWWLLAWSIEHSFSVRPEEHTMVKRVIRRLTLNMFRRASAVLVPSAVPTHRRRGATAVLVLHKPQWHRPDCHGSAVVSSLIAVAPQKTVKTANLRGGMAETLNPGP